jgi:Rrf2 family transcriptional regulator, nitric oxide-sensitive transcriptional repressor
MFSQTAEYALRATVCLAQHAGELLTTQQLAGLTRVPSGYLSKVLQSLVRTGFVEATRGLGGGYQLTRPAKKISLLQIINAVDPLKRIHTCPLKLQSHGHMLCPLHRRIDQAMAEMEKSFATTSLAQVLAEPSESTPLCPVPNARRILETKARRQS